MILSLSLQVVVDAYTAVETASHELLLVPDWLSEISRGEPAILYLCLLGLLNPSGDTAFLAFERPNSTSDEIVFLYESSTEGTDPDWFIQRNRNNPLYERDSTECTTKGYPSRSFSIPEPTR